jgi:hypothetical protein
MLVFAWLAMTLLGFVGCGIIQDDRLQEGNPKRLLNPIDYNGRVCGSSSGVEAKGAGYYLLDGSGL